MTVQAPHSPMPQPSLVPFSFRTSRMSLSAVVSAETSADRGWSFSVNRILTEDAGAALADAAALLGAFQLQDIPDEFECGCIGRNLCRPWLVVQREPNPDRRRIHVDSPEWVQKNHS